jgi:DNA-binding MarR family transcriptional regulator
MPCMERPGDLITTTEARKLLGISSATMTKLIKRAVVVTYSDPLDSRVKLVSRAAVLALKVRHPEAA